MRHLLYTAGVLCAVVPAVLTHAASVSAGKPVSQYITYFSPFVAVTAAAAFILFRYLAEESEAAAKIFSSRAVRRFADMTFGIYMIHPITYVALDKFLHINILSFEPMLSVPVITLISIAMSLAAAAVIRRIPILGRYVV